MNVCSRKMGEFYTSAQSIKLSHFYSIERNASCACTKMLQAVTEVVIFSRFASSETAKWRILDFPQVTKN